MREILFRGKRLDNGEWLEGDLRHGGYFENDPSVYIMASIPGRKQSYINYPVDPATVGQYTGLTDKNGKKIFEGDIVKFRTRSSTFKPLYVRWYEETAQFIVTEQNCVRSYPMDRSWEYEVLGNFYDNIDLLREVDE